MLSIFLTTVLLSAIATFGYGQIRFQSVNAEEFYGSYYGTYVSVTGEQIAEMQKRSEFDRIGRTAVIGEIENTRKISMIWMDEETVRLSNMGKQLQEGTFPQQENEIAGQESMFERLGYPNAKPGDTVTIPFRRNIQEKYQEKDFTISGIMKPTQAEQENQSYTAYVSKACYEELYGPQERVYNIYFTLSDTVSVNSSDLEATIKELAQACGINPEYAAVNGYYSIHVGSGSGSRDDGGMCCGGTDRYFLCRTGNLQHFSGGPGTEDPGIRENPGIRGNQKADEKAGI